MVEICNLVGGRWVAARGDDWIERHNPADVGEVVVRFPAMEAPDVELVMDEAGTGFKTWRQVGMLERATLLADAAAILRSRADDVATDITREMGKTITESSAEVAASIAFLEHYAGLARVAQGDVLADRRTDVHTSTRREPLGVVALITPWNDPLLTPTRKLAPALLAGNSIVLKPALETPLAALHLVSALFDAGVPPGVVNVVTGRPDAIAPTLLEHPNLAAVSFTGSTAVGLELGRRLGGRTVRLQTEMGGKNAVLVLPDADLDAAAQAIVAAGCGQAGQRCTATSRIVVHADVHDELVGRIVQRVEQLVLGPGTTAGTQMGPLVSEEHLTAVLSAVDKARGEGASVVTGGERATGPALDRGWFMKPAVLTGVGQDSGIWQDEVFGPVLVVAPVDSFAEGVSAVNASRYGLAAGVFTRDLAAGHRFADAVDVGQVVVNLPTSGWDVHVPFGGFRDSGSAFKEHGIEGLRFYTRVKSVAVGYGTQG